MIDEKIGRLIKVIFVLVLAFTFFPLLFSRIIPEANNIVPIPADILYVFEFSVIFFFIVYVYKLWKGY